MNQLGRGASLKGNLAALGMAALALAIAFAPLASAFRPLALANLQAACEASSVCAEATIAGAASARGAPAWTVQLVVTKGTTSDQLQQLREAVAATVVKDPTAVSFKFDKTAQNKNRS